MWSAGLWSRWCTLEVLSSNLCLWPFTRLSLLSSKRGAWKLFSWRFASIWQAVYFRYPLKMSFKNMVGHKIMNKHWLLKRIWRISLYISSVIIVIIIIIIINIINIIIIMSHRQSLPVFPFLLQQQLARGNLWHFPLSPVALVLKTQTHQQLAWSHLLLLKIGDYDQVQLMEIALQLQLVMLSFAAHWEGLEKRLQLCLRTGPHNTNRPVRKYSYICTGTKIKVFFLSL